MRCQSDSVWQRCQAETTVGNDDAGWQRARVETLAERLAYARAQSKYADHRGMTALAKAAQTSKGTVSRYESGERGARPDPVIVGRIAKELGVRRDWLLFGEQPMRDDGTLAPLRAPALTLDALVEMYPKRWPPATIEAARAAYLHRAAPEGGWEKLLDDLDALLSERPTPPKPTSRGASRKARKSR